MYTAHLISEGVEKTTGSVYWRVEFTDGVETIAKQYRFALDSDISERKKTVNKELEVLNRPVETATVGALDFSDIADTKPIATQAEIDKQDWFRDFERLKKVQDLINLGVLTGTEPAVTTLRTKLTTGFKPAYIADM